MVGISLSYVAPMVFYYEASLATGLLLLSHQTYTFCLPHQINLQGCLDMHDPEQWWWWATAPSRGPLHMSFTCDFNWFLHSTIPALGEWFRGRSSISSSFVDPVPTRVFDKCLLNKRMNECVLQNFKNYCCWLIFPTTIWRLWLQKLCKTKLIYARYS